jgi:NADH:ubiquinone oxidoreductase subunit K
MKTIIENPIAALVAVASVLFVLGVALVLTASDIYEMNFSIFILGTSLFLTLIAVIIENTDKK